MPLLEGTDGVQKMSKSYGNYIGIAEPPEEIFGKVMSVSDPLMLRYYELLCAEGADYIEKIKSGALHPKEAKERLAFELTARFHGEDAAKKAKAGFTSLFKDKETPQDMEEALIPAEGGVLWIAKVLLLCGLTKSTSEAMRLIEQGGVKIDGERVTDSKKELPTDRTYVIQTGKRSFRRVSFRRGEA